MDENEVLSNEGIVADAPEISSEVISSVSTIDSADSSGAAAALNSLAHSVFGTYTSATQTIVEQYSDGSTRSYTEVIPGLGGLDWYWLSGVLVFCIVLLSFFKLLGVVFKK